MTTSLVNLLGPSKLITKTMTTLFQITKLILSCMMIMIFPFTSKSVLLPDGQDSWQVLNSNIGISAMHMQLLHNNKVIMFDRTDFGPSNLSLSGGQCRYDPYDMALTTDCTAHSLLYDIPSNTFRPLMVQTDTWCSSASLLPNGTLVQTGGFHDGDRVVRTFSPCNNSNDDEQCDWVEHPWALSVRRWYATNQILPDGRIIVMGGRRQFNYEFFPKNDRVNSSSSQLIWFNFLRETRDVDENNLYPFTHLLPDGTLFIFANTRSISLDYEQNRIVKEFPTIPGGDPRNYPSSGSSVLLPIDENQENHGGAEILICGGAPNGSFSRATHGKFMNAISTCGRIRVTDENPKWVMENMPMARVMGDMILLPNTDVVIINGAGLGTAGWEFGKDPVTTPVIYRLYEQIDSRFSVMCPSKTPRLYHSSAILLPDGRVLVGGSNPNRYYNFSNVGYPTELSLDAYSPPYLSVEYMPIRPRVLSPNQVLGYNQFFSITFNVPQYVSSSVVSLRIVSPSFTTHSFGMNQRLVVLKIIRVLQTGMNTYEISAVGPSMPEIAPPGYYMMFVVHAGIPSHAIWVKIQS